MKMTSVKQPNSEAQPSLYGRTKGNVIHCVIPRTLFCSLTLCSLAVKEVLSTFSYFNFLNEDAFNKEIASQTQNINITSLVKVQFAKVFTALCKIKNKKEGKTL